MKNKLNNYIYHKYANLCTKKYLYTEKIKMNKKGISQLVEVAGVLAIIVACIILVVPQAKDAVSGIGEQLLLMLEISLIQIRK